MAVLKFPNKWCHEKIIKSLIQNENTVGEVKEKSLICAGFFIWYDNMQCYNQERNNSFVANNWKKNF